MRHRSPATVPGHRAGKPPAHAGHTLPPEVLTPDEVHRLLRAPSSRAPTGIRNRALLAVLYRAGLRISEALALERRDINAKTGTLTVRHGKGDRHRQVGMDPEGFALLERWLDERRRRGLGRTSIVFCTLDGHRVQPSYVRQLLPRLARKAGIEKRVHPHGLRHTCAAELAVEGVPVPLIQQQLGHASLHTTTLYQRHIAPVELVETMRRREWRP
jgi:site-specific recombinase XerD